MRGRRRTWTWPVAAVLTLALGLTGCSEDAADAPTDASKSDFCEAWGATVEALGASEEPSEEEFDEIIARIDDLEDVGTPEAISKADREGFEVFVSVLDDVDYDEIETLADDSEIPGTNPEDSEKGEAFTDWAFDYCGA